MELGPNKRWFVCFEGRDNSGKKETFKILKSN